MSNKILDFNINDCEKNSEDIIEEIDIQDIAIIGMSGKFPYADNIHEFWNNIANKIDCVGNLSAERKNEIEKYLKYTYKKNTGFEKLPYLKEVDKFDYDFFGIPLKEAIMMDPNHKLFLETAWNAVEDSGYSPEQLKGTQTGVFVGFSGDLQYSRLLNELGPFPSNIHVLLNLLSYIPSRLSYLLNLKGPSIVIDTACSSSLVAVHYACRELRKSECQLAIAGSVRINLLPLKNRVKLDIEADEGQVKAFDKDANGTIFGEGVGAVVLKPLYRAIEDRDSIYAVIKGSAINQDGKSISLAAPNPEGQEKVIVDAWEDAGINPDTIQYIEAHGTGTKLGDPIEIEAIQKAFKRYTDKKDFCAVSSVKSNIGHLDCASGMAGLIKAVLSLKNSKIPPTKNFKNLNPEINMDNSPVYINCELKNWKNETSRPRRCGVSSFGMSGTNCHIILEEAPCYTKKYSKHRKEANLFVLSAKSPESLQVMILNFKNFLARNDSINLGDVCYTLTIGRTHYRHRLALLIRDRCDLIEKLTSIAQLEPREIRNNDIFYGEHRIIRSTIEKRDKRDVSDAEISEMRTALAKKIKENNTNHKHNKDLLIHICKLYIKGAKIDWELFYQGRKNYIRLNLPTYPFKRIKAWIDIETINDEANKLKDSDIILTGKNQADLTRTEKEIAKVWGNILGIREMDIDDTFFDLGGNSLLTVNFEVEIEKSNINLTTSDLEECKTIRNLAALIDCTQNNHNNKNKKNKKSISLEENMPVDGFKIPGIEPFNEFYYRNCLYNSLFPILLLYKESILSVLVNDIGIYEYDEGSAGSKLRVDYQRNTQIEDLLRSEGINVNYRKKSTNLINDLKDSLKKNRPAVIWVDCFYESMRLDTFKKIHWSHTLLIYGYDEKRSRFYILEHEFRESNTYKERLISYSDIINSYQGYLMNFEVEKQKYPSYYEFFPQQESDVFSMKNNYTIIFADNLLKRKDRLIKGIESLKLFVKDFSEIVLDKSLLSENLNYLIQSFNDIINYKQAEFYKVARLFHENSELINVFKSAFRDWRHIRVSLVKFQLTNIYNPEKMHSLIKKLDSICINERKYFDLLISELDVLKRIK